MSATVRSAALCLAVLFLGGALPAAEGDLDPLLWDCEPHARVSHTVTMAAEAVGSPGGAEYRFVCTAGGGKSSSWQAERQYALTGLKPETTYTFVAEVRDAKSGKALRDPSCPVSVQTRGDGAGVKVGHVAAIDKALSAGEIEMVPLAITGDKDNRINIVAVNRWVKGQRDAYNRPDMRAEFIEDSRHVLKAFDAADEEALEPYPAYRAFFNVYAVWWPSIPLWDPQDRKGGMHWEDYNEIRARLFLPWQVEGKGWVTHLAMLNGSGGGGGAGLRVDERVGDAMIVGNRVSPFIHEFNHTAPGLPDEYTSSGLWGRGGEGATTTNDYRRESIRWRAWIEPGTPVPTPYSPKYQDKVGAFEGGVHRMAHLYRPTARGCIMGSGSFAGKEKGLCAVCRQRAIQRFYQWVDPVEDARPVRRELTVRGSQTRHFSVRRVKPDPDTQKTEWRLNGRIIARGTDEIDVTFGPLARYELTFALTDETPYIRPDPPFSHYPHAETRWTIVQAAPAAEAAPLRVALQGRSPVFDGAGDGAIRVEVAGGRPPYTYAWSDGAAVRDRTGLDAGTYELRVTDSDFRTASASIALRRELHLKPDVRSERRDGTWDLDVLGLDGKGAVCTWSTGAKGPTLRGVADGTYGYTIRHTGGAEIAGAVTLAKPAGPLAVAIARVTPSTGGENNGAVELKVAGGRGPYTLAWSDGTQGPEAQRHFLPPGEYTVTVKDANLTARSVTVSVKSEPVFVIHGLRIEKAGPGSVRVADPVEGHEYLWFAADCPPHLPRFPHGIYTGTFARPDGATCPAEAFVIQNKGGLFVDAERKAKNDFGHWVYLMAYPDGRDSDPVTVSVNTRAKGRFDRVLRVEGQTVDETTWTGRVEDGRIELKGDGPAGGTFSLLYASHPDAPDRPLAVGREFAPPGSGNYYLAARNAATGAVSNNRLGFAVTVGGDVSEARPLAPGDVKSAKLLMWLDAADMDGDGKVDDPAPRRGSVMGWVGKAGEVSCKDFIYYLPNVQNGLGVASWKTIWIQGIDRDVKGYRTLVMVRREHEFSSVGTAPWRDLSDLIGIGEYGQRLMSRDVGDEIRGGAVYLNGRKVDPFTAPMPEGFYVATYEFPKPIARGFRRTDGHWEGALAEVLAFDGKLSEAERAGLEEHLRRKWLSAVHLPAAGGGKGETQ